MLPFRELQRQQQLLRLACLLLVFVWLTPTASASNQPQQQEQQEHTADALLQWLHSDACPHGYFNPKQVVRQEDSLFGVFAASPIYKKELLASIPWDCILHTEPVPSNTRFQNCDTVERLVREWKTVHTGGSSKFSLYLQRLTVAAKNHAPLLPTNWSPQGKELLLFVTEHGTLPPYDVMMDEFSWKYTCEQSYRTKEEKEWYTMATLLILTHGEDFGLVPITDLYNHRANGRYVNHTGAYFAHAGDWNRDIGLELRASRDMLAGEPITTDYRDYGPQIGTPELMRDYGFVEGYPQRWIFPQQHVAIHVDVKDDTNPQPVVQMEWLPDHQHENNPQQSSQSCPDEHATEFFQRHLQRLQDEVMPRIHQQQQQQQEGGIPNHELDTIGQFASSLMTAIQLALKDGALEQCLQASD